MMTIFQNISLLYKAIKKYRFFKKSHIMTKEELKQYQYDNVKNTLLYASQKVPYYRNLFKKINFVPERDFNKLEDLQKLPFTTKDILRTHFEEFLSDDIKKLGAEYVMTSGSTGTPLKIALDLESRAAKYAIVYKLRARGGVFFT